jgi:predicted nucleic acid-binding protein
VTRYVVDASVAVEYLLKTPLGLAVADIIEDSPLVAPELLDVETLSALRRSVLHRRLEESRARIAIDDLCHWPVDRIPHKELVPLAWQYRQNVSAYDAFYVAVARLHGIPLLTADGPLAGASGLDVVIQHLIMA